MIRINLLKTEKKGKKASQRRNAGAHAESADVMEGRAEAPFFKKAKPSFPPMALVILLAVVASAVLFIMQNSNLQKERDLLGLANAQKARLQDVVKTLNELERQKQLFTNKINLIRDLQSRQGAAVIILNELSRNLPQWVWLTETSYKNKTLDITGKALENSLIADFISNLESSDYIRAVELVSATQRRESGNTYFEFKLKARYLDPANPNNTGREGTS